MRTSERSSEPKTYFFGSLRVYVDPDRRTNKIRLNPFRLTALILILIALVYAAAVGAGYFWLQKIRHFSQVGVTDVALFRWRAIRRDIGKEQFAAANRDWKAGKYQSAFLSFVTALRNDPDNVDGRLQAADFLVATGASSRAPEILEEGIKRPSRDLALIRKTLELLTSGGRDRQALALIHNTLAADLSGERAPMLRTYEVLATLDLEGASAAHRLLDLHPEVSRYEGSAHTRARVLWESHERFEAIATLAEAVKKSPAGYPDYALLAQYQESAGMVSDARETARLAVERLPEEAGSHILLIAMLDPKRSDETGAWERAINSYMTQFGDSPAAVASLAEIASRKGWVDFVRGIYEVQLTRGREVRLLGLYYADALATRGRTREAQRVLSDLALQVPEAGPLAVMLWQRQVEVASTLGAQDDARDAARRIGSALAQDPDRLALLRRRFEQLGLKDVALELERVAQTGVALAKK